MATKHSKNAPNRVTRSKYPFVQSTKDYPQPEGESLTIEGEALSLRQLLTDYTGNKEAYARPVYYEEESNFASQDLSKIRNLDLSEKLELLNTVKESVSKLKNKLGEEKLHRERLESEALLNKQKNTLQDDATK